MSLVGRVTLVQSVLATISSYTMQNVMLPESVCANIDKICHQFIWRSTSEERRINLVP